MAYVNLHNVDAAGQLGARGFNIFTSDLLTPTGFPTFVADDGAVRAVVTGVAE